MTFGFIVLTFFLFGVCLYFAYRYAQKEFATQLKAFRQQAFKKQRQMRSEIKIIEAKLFETVAITKQLAMSHPAKIDMPSNPLARAEQRMIDEAKQLRVV